MLTQPALQAIAERGLVQETDVDKEQKEGENLKV
jgi:hypothetical protein